MEEQTSAGEAAPQQSRRSRQRTGRSTTGRRGTTLAMTPVWQSLVMGRTSSHGPGECCALLMGRRRVPPGKPRSEGAPPGGVASTGAKSTGRRGWDDLDGGPGGSGRGGRSLPRRQGRAHVGGAFGCAKDGEPTLEPRRPSNGGTAGHRCGERGSDLARGSSNGWRSRKGRTMERPLSDTTNMMVSRPERS